MDRYVVLGRVGIGGMGVVFAAYDPELDRKVALKLMRADKGHTLLEQQTRLLREARLSAKLSHPNVVAVHDVGTFGGQVFLAMDFVEGTTLRQWLDERPRTEAEAMDVLLQAGHGLAAAHQLGIVHQDFKPENVLVDAEERALVTDFGLARVHSTSSSSMPERPAVTNLPGHSLHGGTPGYMAPEQRQGQRADYRSDQYSFCVTLHEALLGHRPGELPTQPLRKISAWRRTALLRGLHPDPERRYESMAALLRALVHDPTKVRLRRARLGALTLSIVGVVATAGYRRYSIERSCQEEATLESTWSAAHQLTVSQAFAASGKPFAVELWKRVQSTLTGYAGKWSATAQENCRATRVAGTQPEDERTRRVACLHRRRSEFSSLVSLLQAPDGPAIEKSLTMAERLSPVEDCAPSVERPRAAAAPLEQSREWQAQIALGKVLALAGQHEKSREELGKLQSLEALPGEMRAEMLFLLGQAEEGSGKYTQAEGTLHEAITTAEAAGAFDVAARAWIQLVQVLGVRQDRNLSTKLRQRLEEFTVPSLLS